MNEKNWWNDQYDKKYFTHYCFGHSYKNMSRFDLNSKYILEIGYGYGRELSQFCNASPYVYGIDISDSAPELANKVLSEHCNILFTPMLRSYDGITIPYNDDIFDFIYSCFVIQHMSKKNAKTLLQNSLQKLKKNGNILFEFFGNPYFLVDYDNDSFSGTKETGMYNNAYNRDQIYQLVNDAGGKIRYIEDWPVKDGTLDINNYWVCINK